MSTVRQVGIKMTVDAQSVTTEVPKAAREFDALGVSAERASARTTRSLAQVQMSVRDIVAGAAGLHVVAGGFNAIKDAILAMPRNAFDYSKQLEVSQVGMSGILGSMTAINGKQTEYNTALGISSDMIRRLNDDALRTAATSQELTTVFQALLAPGLSARMTLDEIRQLTVVGTNAVKSMGLESGQVVQELRDLVAGGITPASSTLATALGLKDSDIAEAKASSEGLFAFLMARMKGFEAASEAFGDTLKGKLDQLKEGATRVAAEGMDPLIVASKQALTEVGKLFVTIEDGGHVSLNAELVNGIREYAQAAVMAMEVGKQWTGAVWENRDAAMALGAVWASVKLGNMVSDTVAAAAAKVELAQASRLAAAQAAVEAQGNGLVVATAREKLAAYMAELQAKVASAQAEAAAQGVQLATLATTREAIVAARAEVVAKLESTRATMAQSEAQIAAARAAGAQSFAMALVREGTEALSAAQARHALLTAELATLGRQQAGVAASVAAATAAQTAATTAAGVATGSLAAAQNAASVSGRTMGAVMGALGGGVGVAITAVTLLVGLLGKMNAEADRASLVGVAKQRLIDGQADTESTQIVAARLSELKRRGLELEAEKKTPGVMAFVFGADYASGLATQIADTKAEIASLEAVTTFAASKVQASQGGVAGGVGQLTLTLTGAEQAWRKVTDGTKTASAAQQEFDTKLAASRQSWETYKTALTASGASSDTIAARQNEQAQVEAALARERDKKIKELGAGAASAHTDALDAQIAAVQQGYKLLASQVADGLDAVDSLRKQDLIDEADQIARRTALQVQGIDGHRKATQEELALMRGKKDSLKEQATLQGKLAELDQQRANVLTKATRDLAEADAKLLKGLDDQVDAAQAAAQQAQQRVTLSRDEAKEIGVVGAALGELRTARVDDAAKQLEAKALTQESIDLSGDTSKALRAQAQAMRDLAAVTDTTAAARAVNDFARAVEESAQAVEFEQRLALVSQRDRAIAIEQYRIAVDLKKRLADIDSKTTTDPKLNAELRGEAEAAAAKAQVTAASRVNIAEWTKSVDQYNDIFRKGFADMLAHGEDAWDAFTTSLATTFETTVADQLYKAFAEPLVIDVVGNVLGFMGVGGKGGSGSSALSSAANAASIYNAGTAIYGMGGIASSAGIISGATYGTAAGSAQSIMLAGQEVGGTIGSAMIAGAEGASSILSVAFDPITLGIGALVAVLASMDDSGTPHMGGAAIADSVAGIKEIEAATIGFGLAASDVSDKVVGTSKTLAGSVLSILQGLDGLSGGKSKFSVATGYADDDGLDGGWGAFRITRNGQSLVDWQDTQTSRWAPKEFADGEDGAKQYGNAIAASVKQAIDKINLPDWAANIVKKLGDSPSMDELSAAMAQIMAMPEQALQAIGTSSQALSQVIYTGMQAADPVGAGAAFAGQITYGIEASLYSGFSQQITGIISTQLVTPVVTAMSAGASITEAMASASIDAMRAQVAAASAAFTAIVSDPGFQDALASVGTLVSSTVSSSIAGLTAPTAPAAYTIPTVAVPAAASVSAAAATTGLANAVDDLRQKAASAVDSLTSTSADLAIELLRAQGHEKAALARERTNYLAQYADLALAEQDRITQLYDGNQAIRDHISQLESEKAATEAAAEAAEKLRSAIDSMYSTADSTASQFLSGEDLSAYRMTRIAGQANAALGSSTLTAQMLDSLGIEDVQRAVIDFVQSNAAPEAKTALMQLGASLIDLKQTAVDAAASAAAARASQQLGLQLEIARLSGDTTAIREHELSVLDGPLNRALQQHVWLLQEQATAAEKTAAVATERSGIERAWLSAIGATAELRRRELDALDPTNRSLQELVYRIADMRSASDAANARVDTSYAGLQKSLDAEKKALAARLATQKDALAAQADAAQHAVSGVKSIFDAITSAIKSTAVESDAISRTARQSAFATLQSAVTQARSGVRVDTLSGVTDALSVLSKPSDRLYARFDDYARAQDAASDVMRQLGDQATGQLSVAELTLSATQGAAKELEKAYQLEVDALDKTAEHWRTAIDVQRGTHIGVLSVKEAIETLSTDLTAALLAKTAVLETGVLPATVDTSQVSVGAVDTSQVSGGAGNGSLQPMLPGIASWVSHGDTSDRMLSYATVLGYYDVVTDAVKQSVWTAAGLDGVPKFAKGGAFTGGGIVQRPTHFDIGQMGESGPEAIMPLSSINGRLGIDARGAGRNPEMLAAILAQNALLARIAAAAEAGAMHGYEAAKAGKDLVDRGVKVMPGLKPISVVTA